VQPRYVADGFILAGNPDGYVVAVPFDASQLRVTGPSRPILESVDVKSGGATEISIAVNGTLAYVTGALVGTDQAMYVDRTGRERVLIKDEGDFRGPRISPSGRQLLVERRVSSANRDIWVYDIASGSRTRLTSDGASQGASWSGDGRRIAWVSSSAASPGGEIRLQAWDGSGSTETLAVPSPIANYVSMARTDAFLMFESNPPGPDDISRLSLDSARVMSPMLATPADEGHASISPDARWYAYASTESGRAEVYVRSINGGSGRVPVSIGGGSEPVWSPRGSEIFYRSGTHMMSARVAMDPEFSVLRRDTLFADTYKISAGFLSTPQAYDVMPNAASFVMLKPLTRGVQHLIIATHWIDDLKRQMSEAQSK
jgi:Tol biopolymer transport system component